MSSRRLSAFLAVPGLALTLMAFGCANDPGSPQPSYMSDDCSAQRQYQSKACIPAPPPPPPAIFDGD